MSFDYVILFFVGVCRFVLWACAGFFGVLRVSLIENVSFRMQRKDTQTNTLSCRRIIEHVFTYDILLTGALDVD